MNTAETTTATTRDGVLTEDVSAPSLLRLFGTADDSIVDGPGIRFAIFVQGCRHGCPGCHNPEAQPVGGGREVSIDSLKQRIEANPLISGITLSGGEPFDQPEPLIELAQWAKELTRTDKYEKPLPPLNVWAYSGYTFDQLSNKVPSPAAQRLMELCDVLVDGLFIEDLRNYTLVWRGSSNQRIIDIAASRAQAKLVEWQPL